MQQRCALQNCVSPGAPSTGRAFRPNGGMTATGGPTHVYLGSTNQWCPCTLLEMVSFQWCAVDLAMGGHASWLPALMAEYDATLVGQHVAAPASREVFAAPTSGPTDAAAVSS